MFNIVMGILAGLGIGIGLGGLIWKLSMSIAIGVVWILFAIFLLVALQGLGKYKKPLEDQNEKNF
jgi:membrane protein YdbS with pleckstrin-like domain